MTWWTILNDDDVVKESSSLSFARSIVPQMFYPKILDCLRVSNVKLLINDVCIRLSNGTVVLFK